MPALDSPRSQEELLSLDLNNIRFRGGASLGRSRRLRSAASGDCFSRGHSRDDRAAAGRDARRGHAGARRSGRGSIEGGAERLGGGSAARSEDGSCCCRRGRYARGGETAREGRVAREMGKRQKIVGSSGQRDAEGPGCEGEQAGGAWSGACSSAEVEQGERKAAVAEGQSTCQTGSGTKRPCERGGKRGGDDGDATDQSKRPEQLWRPPSRRRVKLDLLQGWREAAAAEAGRYVVGDTVVAKYTPDGDWHSATVRPWKAWGQAGRRWKRWSGTTGARLPGGSARSSCVMDEQGALRRVKLDLQRSTATQLQQIAAKARTFQERRRLSAIEVGVQCLSVTTMAAAVARLPTEAKRSDRLLGGMCVSWPRFASDRSALREARPRRQACVHSIESARYMVGHGAYALLRQQAIFRENQEGGRGERESAGEREIRGGEEEGGRRERDAVAANTTVLRPRPSCSPQDRKQRRIPHPP